MSGWHGRFLSPEQCLRIAPIIDVRCGDVKSESRRRRRHPVKRTIIAALLTNSAIWAEMRQLSLPEDWSAEGNERDEGGWCKTTVAKPLADSLASTAGVSTPLNYNPYAPKHA